MPTRPLPENPSLEQLRRQARDLQRAVRRAEPAALALAAEFGSPAVSDQDSFPLNAAQLVIARRYDVASWPRLVHRVEVLRSRSWAPDAPVPAGEDPVNEFLRLACPGERDAQPGAAGEFLRRHPDLTTRSAAVAAAAGDAPALSEMLVRQPQLAVEVTGPYDWSPLLYLAYARLDPAPEAAAAVRSAQLLLSAGADPNDGRFWRGLATPFTVLTGVFGAGELAEPGRRRMLPLARLLLDAGADPNDGQTLYNRMFSTDDDHLELLFAYGLGGSAPGPWYRMLEGGLEPPAAMLRNLLWWAICHDQRDRVRLLAQHGVDVAAPFTELRYRSANGRTPAAEALVSGRPEMAVLLQEWGAPTPELEPVESFAAAALAGSREAAGDIDQDTVAAARRHRPGLLTWAAELGRLDAVELLLDNGFDPNAFGRSDAPIGQPWHGPLHVAAGNGDRPMAELLLSRGADPTARDRQFKATPLGWAEHFGRTDLVELLTPVSPPN